MGKPLRPRRFRQRRAIRCGGCGRPVSQPHLAGCSRSSQKSRTKNEVGPLAEAFLGEFERQVSMVKRRIAEVMP